MRRITIAVLLLSIVTLLSCKTKQVATNVQQAENVNILSRKGMVYTLPKTVFRVKVKAVHTSVLPGPYSQFAEKYLGISNVFASQKNQWEIQEVNVFSFTEPDLKYFFVVEPGDDYKCGFMQLTQNGLIIPSLQIGFQNIEHGVKPLPAEFFDPRYHDLSPTPFIATETTTHYSRVLQDSVFIRVPVHKTVVLEKSLEDKAREAAEFIFSLRKRRFELLSGDADFVAEGKAVDIVLNEIKRLEDEYLTLFTGKRHQTFSTHWFNYSVEPEGQETAILFRFSATRGVLSPSDLSGSPVIINITSPESWKGIEILNKLANEKDLPRTDLVYYRLPVPVSIRISDSQTEFFNSRSSVFQLGPLLRIPPELLVEKVPINK